ncbi:MAG TPA: type I glutamate--ammonia ligase [Anaerolineaceae bacterium]|nr:MAG: Strongly similar to glutamate-ammonia ligase GlnA [Anaerolineaceae bacterium 46_22]HAF48744.1 type I glutamate--ammonia ligase [Anaerolineaceae bacterium]
MNSKDVLKRIKEDHIKFISFQFTDVNGVVKSVDGPVNQLEKALEDGIWFDGSSVEGFARIQESDMHLVVDPDTYAILPWTPDDMKRARVLCDIYQPNGQPFEGDPRGVLKRRLARLKEEHNWIMNVGPEPEFFLFLQNGKENIHPVPHDVGGYFDFSANDEAVQVRTELMSALNEMGLEIEVGHHEVALGQHEIDFRFADALKTADNVLTLKYAVKAIAAQHGLIASFMPKPVFGINGSGMHCHLSIFDLEGNNLFYSGDDPFKLSELAYKFIAGQLRHARATSAVVAPTVNSYKRLVPGYEAPVYIGWAQVNRSALIRIPQPMKEKQDTVRLELRFPDPSSNPYLAFNAMLAAGLDGIEKDLPCPKPLNQLNVYDLSEDERVELGIEMLPSSLLEAMSAFEGDKVLQDALGESLTGAFIKSRYAEWEDFRTHVTDWELNRYLTTA